MSNKRLTPVLVALIAALVVLLAVLIGGRLLNGDRSLLRNVVVRESTITPNADGADDVPAPVGAPDDAEPTESG